MHSVHFFREKYPGIKGTAFCTIRGNAEGRQSQPVERPRHSDCQAHALVRRSYLKALQSTSKSLAPGLARNLSPE